MDNKDLCEHTRIRLIAAAIGHQKCTKTAANVIPLPGTEREVAFGAPDELRALLPATTAAQPLDLDKLVDADGKVIKDFRKNKGNQASDGVLGGKGADA